MAAEDSIPEQIWNDRKLKIGPSVRPSPVFKAIERLSFSQELRIYIGAKNRKCDILHRLIEPPRYWERAGEPMIKNVENLFSFPFPSLTTQNTSGRWERCAVIVTNDPFFAESVIIVVRVFGANKALGDTWYLWWAHHYPGHCLWQHLVTCDDVSSGAGYCDLWHLWDWAPVTRHSPPPPSQESSHIPLCTAAHCWVLRLKLTPGATQIWDSVGIDIDPSQTNGRPQISECGAAWSWEAHQLRQRETV